MERAGAREEAGGAAEAGHVWPGEISICICVSVSRVAWEAYEVLSLSLFILDSFQSSVCGGRMGVFFLLRNKIPQPIRIKRKSSILEIPQYQGKMSPPLTFSVTEFSMVALCRHQRFSSFSLYVDNSGNLLKVWVFWIHPALGILI